MSWKWVRIIAVVLIAVIVADVLLAAYNPVISIPWIGNVNVPSPGTALDSSWNLGTFITDQTNPTMNDQLLNSTRTTLLQIVDVPSNFTARSQPSVDFNQFETTLTTLLQHEVPLSSVDEAHFELDMASTVEPVLSAYSPANMAVSVWDVAVGMNSAGEPANGTFTFDNKTFTDFNQFSNEVENSMAFAELLAGVYGWGWTQSCPSTVDTCSPGSLVFVPSSIFWSPTTIALMLEDYADENMTVTQATNNLLDDGYSPALVQAATIVALSHGGTNFESKASGTTSITLSAGTPQDAYVIGPTGNLMNAAGEVFQSPPSANDLSSWLTAVNGAPCTTTCGLDADWWTAVAEVGGTGSTFGGNVPSVTFSASDVENLGDYLMTNYPNLPVGVPGYTTSTGQWVQGTAPVWNTPTGACTASACTPDTIAQYVTQYNSPTPIAGGTMPAAYMVGAYALAAEQDMIMQIQNDMPITTTMGTASIDLGGSPVIGCFQGCMSPQTFKTLVEPYLGAIQQADANYFATTGAWQIFGQPAGETGLTSNVAYGDSEPTPETSLVTAIADVPGVSGLYAAAVDPSTPGFWSITSSTTFKGENPDGTPCSTCINYAIVYGVTPGCSSGLACQDAAMAANTVNLMVGQYYNSANPGSFTTWYFGNPSISSPSQESFGAGGPSQAGCIQGCAWIGWIGVPSSVSSSCGGGSCPASTEKYLGVTQYEEAYANAAAEGYTGAQVDAKNKQAILAEQDFQMGLLNSADWAAVEFTTLQLLSGLAVYGGNGGGDGTVSAAGIADIAAALGMPNSPTGSYLGEPDTFNDFLMGSTYGLPSGPNWGAIQNIFNSPAFAVNGVTIGQRLLALGPLARQTVENLLKAQEESCSPSCSLTQVANWTNLDIEATVNSDPPTDPSDPAVTVKVIGESTVSHGFQPSGAGGTAVPGANTGALSAANRAADSALGQAGVSLLPMGLSVVPMRLITQFSFFGYISFGYGAFIISWVLVLLFLVAVSLLLLSIVPRPKRKSDRRRR